METREVLTELRKQQGLTQDEMAEGLFVTRQAVSRWETGETIPNTETLKIISRKFDISINTLLGQPQDLICQSCSMPLNDIDNFGTEVDGEVNTDYCVHCYKGGGFAHDCSLEEQVETNLRFLVEYNAEQGLSYTEDEARAILKIHLGTLKRWKESVPGDTSLR
jgi:transcriptional regulator with XRE-family HTH domain